MRVIVLTILALTRCVWSWISPQLLQIGKHNGVRPRKILGPEISAMQQRGIRRYSSATEREEFVLEGADGKPIDLTLSEKERIFVEAMQSYYYSGRQTLSDKDFDLLKEDLMWEGSEYAMLSRNETLFLNAMAAYSKGEPLLSDTEFDELKASLKAQNSIVAVSKEPKCYVDTGVCSVTFREDKFRELVLYAPASLLGLLFWAGGTYELMPMTRNFNPLLTIALGLPIVLSIAQFVTEKIIFVDPLIAQGPCPNCNVNNRIFFGDILGVEGPGEEVTVACTNCKAPLTIRRDTLRVYTDDLSQT
uniref:PGR5-like protein 1A, chloroplastic n=1 Tax=Aureoumbra lagunensis TaxID=44058 RepID=A0A7S3JSA6_9STRA|mmetsp:Transcript_14149/g.18911  ORF Transcript_14149/g.18911 Transcript_14149/m.18911 type:complete len:304 (+) Transcript_14149:49-960(+)